MSFEVDRCSSAWAHIALCADLTWALEPPDAFIAANQRLWAQHCRVSQVFQESDIDSSHCVPNHCELADKLLVLNQEGCSCNSRRSVKDVIPESRLAQFYGDFYYNDIRENCYTCANEKLNVRGYNVHGCDNADLTEYWMLPEVEYWFRKLVACSPDRSMIARRRRQFKIVSDDDSERCGPRETRAAEATLQTRVQSTQALWNQTSYRRQARVPSPPPASRKIRARRRQPRRLNSTPPPPAFSLNTPSRRVFDPTFKFQFDVSHQQLTEYQRAMGRLSAGVQAVMKANACRCPFYRGTNVSRYVPSGPRPVRYPDRRCGIWWPRESLSPRLQNQCNVARTQNTSAIEKTENSAPNTETKIIKEEPENESSCESPAKEPDVQQETSEDSQQTLKLVDNHLPSTSASTIEQARNKRLYSTVLSTTPPPTINLSAVGCLRLAQKLPPGLIKLNQKTLMPSRVRPKVDNKFEELEKEALEQYKASDESIDSKFRELEKEAADQYCASNSNTSCSSGNSGEKKTTKFSPDNVVNTKTQTSKFNNDNSANSVVVYSQNFPNHNAKENAKSVTNLKNFHTPPKKGGRKEQTHRTSKCTRNNKIEFRRATSDTDYEARGSNTKGRNKGAMRSALRFMPPKKRHLTSYVSDYSSTEELNDAGASTRATGPRIKNRAARKLKISYVAHGGGDLHPIMGET